MKNTLYQCRHLLVMALLGTMPLSYASNSCSNQNMAIPFSTQVSDFTDNNDGTLSHTPTQLMWMRCALGQSWSPPDCTGASSLLTWQDALNAASSSNFAGHTDWRLPNKNELASLIENRCWDPSIDSGLFPATQQFFFWTATPDNTDANSALAVAFDRGRIFQRIKTETSLTRLVRDINLGP